MLNAFCRVAPSVRFSSLAIFAAGFFLRASNFNSRTCSFVQARLVVVLFFTLFSLRLSMGGAYSCIYLKSKATY
jgi:hypothetical protein